MVYIKKMFKAFLFTLKTCHKERTMNKLAYFAPSLSMQLLVLLSLVSINLFAESHIILEYRRRRRSRGAYVRVM